MKLLEKHILDNSLFQIIHSIQNGNTYGQAIVRDTGLTESTVRTTIPELEEQGYINTQKEGRRRVVELTELGEEISKHFADLKKLHENGVDVHDETEDGEPLDTIDHVGEGCELVCFKCGAMFSNIEEAEIHRDEMGHDNFVEEEFGYV